MEKGVGKGRKNRTLLRAIDGKGRERERETVRVIKGVKVKLAEEDEDEDENDGFGLFVFPLQKIGQIRFQQDSQVSFAFVTNHFYFYFFHNILLRRFVH